MKTSRFILGCILASFCFLAGGAGAQVITEFSAGISGTGLWGITAGPDGNLWFTEFDRIGRITPDGIVTEFGAGITAGARPFDIAAGPDGNLWFTEQDGNRIGRITPAGVVTEFSAGISAGAGLYDITAGPDGNVWFTERSVGRIGRITPAGVVTEFDVSAAVHGITAGPDGNVWFTESHLTCSYCFVGRIGRITPLGVVTFYGLIGGVTTGPLDITAGPDGNLWFTQIFGWIGRITPLGIVTEFGVGNPGGAFPVGITAGPDGNLWFADGLDNRIGRITPAGVVTKFSAGMTTGAHPNGIAAGPDGNLWFTEPGVNRIGRITTAPVAGPPFFLSAVSRKTHGAAGVFDLVLSSVATNPTTEPRLGPAHTLVVSFDKPLISATATVTEGIGTAIVSSFIANNVVVDLTGVMDQQYVTISLSNVASSDGGTGGSGSVRIGFLAGDVNQSRVVSLADVGLVNAQLAQPVTVANFLTDVNASGTLTVADRGITSANLAKALPAP